MQVPEGTSISAISAIDDSEADQVTITVRLKASEKRPSSLVIERAAAKYLATSAWPKYCVEEGIKTI